MTTFFFLLGFCFVLPLVLARVAHLAFRLQERGRAAERERSRRKQLVRDYEEGRI